MGILQDIPYKPSQAGDTGKRAYITTIDQYDKKTLVDNPAVLEGLKAETKPLSDIGLTEVNNDNYIYSILAIDIPGVTPHQLEILTTEGFDICLGEKEQSGNVVTDLKTIVVYQIQPTVKL